jgi:hypothetical protein
MEDKVTIHTFSRVASYSFVSNFWGAANQYYSTAKNSDYGVLRGAVTTAERIVTPALSTLAKVPTYCPNVVERLDTLAMNQLDHAENLVEKSSDYAKSTKDYAGGVVERGSNYLQTTKDTLRENSVQFIQPIAQATSERLTRPREYVTAYFQQNKVVVEQLKKQSKSEDEKKVYFAPLFRFAEHFKNDYVVSPFNYLASNVKSVSANIDQRRKFAMEMFRANKSAGEQKLLETKRGLEDCIQKTTEVVQENKKSTSRRSVALAIRTLQFQKYLVSGVRNAIQYVEKQRPVESSNDVNYVSYVPPTVIQYATTSVDVTDNFLNNCISYLESFSRNQTPPTSQKESDVEKNDILISDNENHENFIFHKVEDMKPADDVNPFANKPLEKEEGKQLKFDETETEEEEEEEE